MEGKKLNCPLCYAETVERIKLTTPQGKGLIATYASKVNSERERKKLLVLQKIQASDSIYIYHCLKCNNFEIWNTSLKKNLVKLSFIDTVKAPEPKRSKTRARKIARDQQEIILGIIISTGIAFAAFYTLYFALYFMSLPPGNLIELPFNSATFLDDVNLIVLVSVAIFIVVVVMLANIILAVIDKRIQTQEFTMRLHQLLNGPHFYFLEYNAKYEKKNFGASLKRSLYGSTLILGIAIMVLENFLVIPDLKPMFWSATYTTIITLVIALPFVVILLYVSPLLTMEVNLYYFDKKDRIVKNVGSWLEEALHFFAIVDIVLTIVVMLDSNMNPSWFLFIAGFVMLIFTFFLVFTVTFNKRYHARLKEKLIEYLKGKYNLPFRKASIVKQQYFCRNCGKEVDFVQQDHCQYCNTAVHKCSICGEVVDVRHFVGKSLQGIEIPENKGTGQITNLIDRMETRMSGTPGMEDPIMQCPSCQKLFHMDEFIAWLKLRGTCPVCRTKLNFFDLF
ncbi:MAG TPA: hypothetical protein VKM55_26295 [Candidatus Lokiarchaeia archaeon]|nr:hypothetical protein [Candidatus Lokiarchaeia archaeon]